ncbi:MULTISPECIES: alpha/beta hydrolase [unclassified Shewanella]|uniref:alpha/beta hydrolase n=1 Tax=unclassified Shewanella TaxID=196818 RepID=UPI001BB9DEEB|nr:MULTISPECIES: alpha/beta fold hydrolase [unclassified Shewanella]GIU17739.1 alpha/beta hydrolase [Shewanella sp. MBTL60-112-B1]GIU33388.1 alpha/beta hydrolase [Shewanella sp. MBTL60-112-B2]
MTKAFSFLAMLLLTGCSINITPDTFIYQDDVVEKNLNLAAIKSELTLSDAAIEVTAVSLTTHDGLTLKGIQLLHEEALANLIFFGGSGMKISTSSGILRKFASLPVNVIWFDYRGTGVSEKKEALTVKDMQIDALAVFDFATDNLPSTLPTVIHGLSMGSLLASYTANQRGIDALVLDGAISSVPELVDNVVPSWSKLFSTVTVATELTTIDNIELVKHYHAPLLLLVGDDDSTTPIEFSQALYDASASANKTLTILADTGHGESMKKDEALKAYTNFIKDFRRL